MTGRGWCRKRHRKRKYDLRKAIKKRDEGAATNKPVYLTSPINKICGRVYGLVASFLQQKPLN